MKTFLLCLKRMRLIPVLFLSLAASAFAQHRPAKEWSIWIGIPLRLGMPRDAIIATLNENYGVTKMKTGTGDDWIVTDKMKPSIWEGYLGFRDGKLTYASRSWTHGDENKYALAQALWDALARMESDGQHSCSFELPTTRSPIAEVRYVRLYCGAKRIEIMITSVFSAEGRGQEVSISEILSSEAY